MAFMPRSGYVAGIRARIGNDLLVLPSVSACVFDALGALLLVRHADEGWWALPGGAVEPDEVPADALVREVREETGLDIEPDEVIGVYGGKDFRVEYANGDQVSYVLTAYACQVIGGQPRPDGEEICELSYVTSADLEGLHMPRWAPSVLADAFAWKRAR
jgi:ADP-ribose pyrophosphatase YjhB (NUDIX family)